MFTKKLLSIKSPEKFKLITLLREFPESESVYSFGDTVHYTGKDNNIALTEIEKYLKENNIKVSEIKEIEPNIEDTFIALMEGKNNGQ